jgi:tetratricopeptide (TPR) repeat protein
VLPLHRIVASFAFGLTVVAAAPVWAQDEAPKPALEHHDEAKRLYARGDYVGAVQHLRHAVQLDPDAKTLFYNLGLIEEKLGRIDDAIADYRRCLELASDDDEREELGLVIQRLQGARGQNAFGPRPATPAPAPPPPPPPRREGVSPWVWVAGATAMSSFVVATILASRAAATDPGNETVTSSSKSLEQLQSDADAAHQLAMGADIALGIGAAATAATVIVALTTSGSGAPEQPAIALTVAPTAIAMRVQF